MLRKLIGLFAVVFSMSVMVHADECEVLNSHLRRFLEGDRTIAVLPSSARASSGTAAERMVRVSNSAGTLLRVSRAELEEFALSQLPGRRIHHSAIIDELILPNGAAVSQEVFESAFKSELREIARTEGGGRAVNALLSGEKFKTELSQLDKLSPEEAQKFFERQLRTAKWWSRSNEQKTLEDIRRSGRAYERVSPLRKPDFEDLGQIRVGTTMKEIEKRFDTLCRKTQEVPGSIHEVDSAFAYGGIPETRLGFRNNQFVADRLEGEKWFAIGHDGALKFQGAMSSTGSNIRYYVVVYPKGYVAERGLDLAQAVRDGTVSAGRSGIKPDALNVTQFTETVVPQNRFFYILHETSTAKFGQTKIGLRDEWSRFSVNGQRMSHSEMMRMDAAAVVEFDEAGTVLGVRFLGHP